MEYIMFVIYKSKIKINKHKWIQMVKKMIWNKYHYYSKIKKNNKK